MKLTAEATGILNVRAKVLYDNVIHLTAYKGLRTKIRIMGVGEMNTLVVDTTVSACIVDEIIRISKYTCSKTFDPVYSCPTLGDSYIEYVLARRCVDTLVWNKLSLMFSHKVASSLFLVYWDSTPLRLEYEYPDPSVGDLHNTEQVSVETIVNSNLCNEIPMPVILPPLPPGVSAEFSPVNHYVATTGGIIMSKPLDLTKPAVSSQTLIFGVPEDEVEEVRIIAQIRQFEANIKDLKGIENKPKMIVDKINDFQNKINALVEFLDSKEVSNAGI